MKEQIEKRKRFIKENNKDVELGKEVRPGVKLTKINPETDSYIQDCKFGLKEAQEKRLNEFIRSKKKTADAADVHSRYVSKLQKAGEKSAKKIKKLEKAGKIGLGVTAAGALTTAGYKLHKANKKKSKKNDN